MLRAFKYRTARLVREAETAEEGVWKSIGLNELERRQSRAGGGERIPDDVA